MRVALERLERSRVRLEVDVAEDEVRRVWEQVARQVIGRTTIPGFRKGRAPRRLVERHLGGDVFRREALDRILPDAYARALDQNRLEPVDAPELEVHSFEEGGPLRFTATVDVRPEVELDDYRGMGIEVTPAEVTGEQVERELEGLREAHAQLEDRGTEPLRPGWFALLGYRATTAGDSLDEVKEQERLVELGSPGLPPGMSEALDEARVGDTREFTLTLPDDAGYGPAAGREVRVAAVIKAVKEKVLPAPDDGFARTVAGLDSLEELREKVKNRLAAVARLEATARVQETIITRVTEAARVDLPEAMVERRRAGIKGDLEADLARRGLNLDTYLQAIRVDAGQFEADLRTRAEQEVKQDLVLDAVARAENVAVTAEEVEAEYERLRQRYGESAVGVREQFPPEAVERVLVRRKTVDYLLRANATGLETAEEQEAVK